MQVYINREPVAGPWGGGNNFVRAFWEFADTRDQLTRAVSQGFPPGSADEVELCNDPSMNINPDVMLVVGLDNQGPTQISVDQAVLYRMYVNPTCKIVLRVNECDARKGTTGVDDMLLKVSEHVDGTVFVSNWLHDYFNNKGWACKEQAVIYNGVQRSIFKPAPKLDNGKVNIVTVHWSDNAMKGQDFVEWTDEFVGMHSDEFTFTFIGRTKAELKHSTHIRPLSGQRLGEEIGTYDICINASRFDPGPNSVIEPITCGLPTYVHGDGGGGVEFAGEDHVFSSFNELERLLLGKKFKQNTTNFKPWKQCITEYTAFLQSIVNP